MGGSTMKAITVDKPGGPEALQLSELPRPKVAPGQVLIKAHATALNGADMLQRSGLYPAPEGASQILGLEVAGEVAEVGEGAKRFKPGDKVFALLDGGGYSEYVVASEGLVMPMPESLTFESAAAIAEVWLTAYLELVWLASLQAGEDVLIHAGASGVGTAAIQVAKSLGARVFVTAGSDEKLQLCKELGADVLINYKKQDFVEVVRERTAGKTFATGVPGGPSGRTQDWGIDVILDLVGGVHFASNLEVLCLEGRLLLVGTGGGTKAEIDLTKVMTKRLEIIGSTMRARPLQVKEKLVQGFSKFALDNFATGKFKPIVDRSFPLKEARAAHEYMASKKNKGKVVLTM